MGRVLIKNISVALLATMSSIPQFPHQLIFIRGCNEN